MRTHSLETREKMRQAKLGRTFSLETRKKMSLAHTGKLKPWATGFHGKHSEATKEKMRLANLGFKRPYRTKLNYEQVGEKHGLWKGEKVGYRSLHRWVERQIGKPDQCSECKKIAYGHQMHWANKSREYKRDLTDWLRLCAKCHKKYDAKLK